MCCFPELLMWQTSKRPAFPSGITYIARNKPANTRESHLPCEKTFDFLALSRILLTLRTEKLFVVYWCDFSASFVPRLGSWRRQTFPLLVLFSTYMEWTYTYAVTHTTTSDFTQVSIIQFEMPSVGRLVYFRSSLWTAFPFFSMVELNRNTVCYGKSFHHIKIFKTYLPGFALESKGFLSIQWI